MSGNRVLCTGGAGFLGSALCSQLVKEGHMVVSFDNYSRKSHQNTINKNIIEYNGDIRNIDNINDCIENNGPFDTLWHLAYINGTKTFYSHPELVLEVGVKGATNTLDAAIKHKIRNYFLVSSSEVYNEPTSVPTTEYERLMIPDVHNPRFSYSGGKIISELMTIHYGSAHGLNTKIFRPHNVYAQNMGLEHVVVQIIEKIVSPKNLIYIDNKLVVNIQGTGKETRAFCYIDDAINELILASNATNIEQCPIYNIGIQEEITIEQLVYTIADILDIKIVIQQGEKTLGSTDRRCPSMKKISELGYIPTHNLRDGLTKTIKWYKDYFNNTINNKEIPND
jgi:nucleoside-diphosphate-sugar epimerase